LIDKNRQTPHIRNILSPLFLPHRIGISGKTKKPKLNPIPETAQTYYLSSIRKPNSSSFICSFYLGLPETSPSWLG